MAGDWIKMRTDLADDPAVIAMAVRLRVDELAIVGRLHAIWSWLDRQSRSGQVIGVTHAWVDRHVRLEGFAAAMVAVSWLVVGETGLSVPNFDRHNGETAKQRALNTRNKQVRRAPLVPEMSRSDQDNSATREEKRREEKKDRKLNAREAVESFEVTDDLRRWAAEKVSGVNVDAATDSWRDFLRANGYRTRQGPVLNATSSWRNWMRNEVKFDRGNNGNRNSTARNGRSTSRSEPTPPREAREPIVVTGRTPKF